MHLILELQVEFLIAYDEVTGNVSYMYTYAFVRICVVEMYVNLSPDSKVLVRVNFPYF